MLGLKTMQDFIQKLIDGNNLTFEESKIEAKEGETVIKTLQRLTELDDLDKRERELTAAKLMADAVIKEEAMNAVSNYFESLGMTAYAEGRAD